MADLLGTRSQERVAPCWLDFVNRFVEAFEVGRTLPTAQLPQQPLQPLKQVARQKAILCSPHPDDEALVGGLALRLRLEAGVLNCAITLGSRRDDRKRRLAEVESSCGILSFRLLVLNKENGLEDVKPDFGENCEREWHKNVESLAHVFVSEEPDLVSSHTPMITTRLISARTTSPWTPSVSILIGATVQGYSSWKPNSGHAMTEPNLMVGLSPSMLAHVGMATAEHGGEVMRNPYHVTSPARLMDNVRRGSEILGSFGKEASPFLFAELYRVSAMKARGHETAGLARQVIAPNQVLCFEGQRLFAKPYASPVR